MNDSSPDTDISTNALTNTNNKEPIETSSDTTNSNSSKSQITPENINEDLVENVAEQVIELTTEPTTVISKEQLELLDVLDDTGLPTGKQRTRIDVHKEGLWHRSLHLWIVREEDGVFYILLQRRSRKKDLEGGMVDVTVGGHFAAGESFVDVLREAEEEVGLQISPVELNYLHTQQVERFYPDQTNPERIDREFQEVYFCQCDQALEAYFLNPEEVDILYEIPLDAAIALYDEGEPILAAGYDSQSRNNNAMLIEDDLIGQARADTLDSLKAIKTALASPTSPEKLTN